MAKETKEVKIVLERNYTIPLRKEWLKVPKYKRAEKAIRAVKQFLAKHMKVDHRDVNKIKIDKWVNEALWLRGMRKPSHKISVKAIKYSDGIVKVEFIGLPAKFKIDEEKFKKKIDKAKKKEQEKQKEKEKKKPEEKKPEVKEEKSDEEKIEDEEKREREKMLHKEIAKEQPKAMQPLQHKESKDMRRKALEK